MVLLHQPGKSLQVPVFRIFLICLLSAYWRRYHHYNHYFLHRTNAGEGGENEL